MINKELVWTLPKSFLRFCYGSVIICAFLIFTTNFLGLTSNPFYSNTSLFLFFISTVLVYKIALQNTALTFCLSFTLLTAFSQRIIVTYFFPESIDYQIGSPTGNNRLVFTDLEVDFGLFFYTICVGSALFGFLLAGNKSIKIPNTENIKNIFDFKYINFFVFKFKTIDFIKTIIWFYIITVLVKIGIILNTGIGLTGATHSDDQALLHFISTRSIVIKNFAFFGVILLMHYEKKNKLTKLFFSLYFIESLVAASRAFLLSLAQTFIIIYYILRKKIKLKYLIISITIIVGFGAIYYVLLTVLRNYFLTGELYFTSINVFLYISRAFSQFDTLLLWIEMPSQLYEKSVGFFPDLILFINSFVIGDLIADPDRVNLGKLMVQYGRQSDFDIFSLAGHSENPGAFATTYMYLGLYGGMIYWFLHGFVLTVFMNSKIHTFWKFAIISSFAFGPNYVVYTTFASLVQPLLVIGLGIIAFDFIKSILGNKKYLNIK